MTRVYNRWKRCERWVYNRLDARQVQSAMSDELHVPVPRPKTASKSVIHRVYAQTTIGRLAPPLSVMVEGYQENSADCPAMQAFLRIRKTSALTICGILQK